jgi:hypothetical protein
MAGRGKKKTTMAKLNREAKLRERRFEKAARKEARRFDAINGIEPDAAPAEDEFEDDSDSESEPEHAVQTERVA